MHMTQFNLPLPAEADTLALGSALADCLAPGLVIYLSGELGAGKTTLVRGLLRKLGVGGKVKSPTFTLVEVYEVSRLYLYHFDFYRFMGSGSGREFEETGFREHFNPQSICIVEWPEKAAGLPPADLRIELKIELQAPTAADSGRIATIFADSEAGVSCLKRFTMT
jgi:tRNA threonylcarbamoyladenosine biosynthesis protein TsaE